MTVEPSWPSTPSGSGIQVPSAEMANNILYYLSVTMQLTVFVEAHEVNLGGKTTPDRPGHEERLYESPIAHGWKAECGWARPARGIELAGLSKSGGYAMLGT